MEDETHEADEQVLQAGREAAAGLAERFILQALIDFLADHAEDPDAFRERLRDDALARVDGVRGSDNLPPAFMAGVREFAAEAVQAILAPPEPVQH